MAYEDRVRMGLVVHHHYGWRNIRALFQRCD